MDEKTPAKKRFLIFNMNLIIRNIAIIAIVVMTAYFIKPSANPEKLPNFRIHQKAVKILINFNNNLHSNRQTNVKNLTTNPNALSLYLTSLIAPEAVDLQKSSPDILPRIIVKAPENDLKKISLIKYSKFFFLPVRLELNFKQYDSDVWVFDTWKFCNFPVMSAAKDKVWEYAVKDFESHPKMKKIFSSDLRISRKKSNIIINVNKHNNTKAEVKKFNSAIPVCLNLHRELPEKQRMLQKI